jgi:DNA-binding LacI/PurR family transcriptional regulator
MERRAVSTDFSTSGTTRPATIYDVARLAQVSHQTVSRYLKGHPGIKAENRQRVQDALAALNYRPNATARALATNRSRRIGAMVYDLIESGPAQFIKGAGEAAREAGYLLDIVSVGTAEGDVVVEAIELLNQPDLAGVIALTPTDRMRAALESTAFQVPLFLETESEDSASGRTGTARTLNSQGAELLVDHLVRLGHRRILHIAGPQEWVSARNRAHAYEQAMRDRGLEPLPAIEGDWSAASGYAATQRMPLDAGVTALLVANDQMALGALWALRERQIEVPAAVSVVGFDDIPESAFFSPPLTTLRLNFDWQGRHAVRMLVAEIEGRAAPDEPVTLGASVVPRASTAAARR